MIYTMDDFMKTYFPREFEKQRLEKMTVKELAHHLAEKNMKLVVSTGENPGPICLACDRPIRECGGCDNVC